MLTSASWEQAVEKWFHFGNRLHQLIQATSSQKSIVQADTKYL